MNPSLWAIFLLGIPPLTNAANFNQVYQWDDELDYEWPSEERKTQTLEDGSFKPENIEPRFMTVYGSRMFLSLYKHHISIPASLVSFPTMNASSASPKLTPFPSWNIHEPGKCSQIREARGQKVDSIGRLWVLDSGGENCNAKIWTIDLSNNDETKIIHQFTFHGLIHDLVLDETPEGTFAYITRWRNQHFVVFSSERKESWIVETQGMEFFSITLSPKHQEPRQLYLSYENGLYSIPVAALRNRSRIAYPILIGEWSAEPYSMLMDNHGTLYATFFGKSYISIWNTLQPFEEQRFHEATGLDSVWPFTLALHQNTDLWILESNKRGKPKFLLLKVAVDAQFSGLDGASGAEGNVAENAIQECKKTPIVAVVVVFIVS